MGGCGSDQYLCRRNRFVWDFRSIHGALQCDQPAQASAGIILMAMVNDIERLLESYRSWLRDKTTLRQLDGSWVEITTPYLDRHNDALQIYAKRSNGGYLLSDDGYTIHDLEASGCSLKSPKRQDLLKITLNGFGVKVHDGALEVNAAPENFPLRKHSLIQAMLAA